MAVVGVLALQGSYNEHLAALRRIGVRGVEVRKPEQLLGLDSLIIPGGESTTMAKLANYHNLVGQKTGGQELVGGLDCTVHRNFFGSQLQSFETELSVPKLAEKEGGNDTCHLLYWK
ncbi:putative pyridoxal 5' [Panicum miliaceum]|uniref:glutaminase n=1 Tax=Panicum miliaceum TaxID=4540 RepID=A0A3L6RTL8_PANMI|nr:putative pyridoxal 5' [Panicum miliaceum]